MIGAVVILLSAAACAGHSSDESGSGGAMNAAGSSGAHAGANGSGATGAGGKIPELPAQGALTAFVGQPAVHVDQMNCPVTETYQVGAPQAPTATDPGQSVVSGDAGSSISCIVKGQGTFSFSGSLHASTSMGDLISIAFSNGVVTPDFTGTADMSIFTPQLAGNFSSGTPCAIHVLDQQVKPGSMWATFACAQVLSPPSGLCGLTGTIVFENCAQM